MNKTTCNRDGFNCIIQKKTKLSTNKKIKEVNETKFQINEIITGDALSTLKQLPNNYINCCITSPPYYGLRDYGVDNQIGIEERLGDYIHKLTGIFHEVRRVLKDDGTLWINIGDSYTKSKKQNQCKVKDLLGVPWELAFALRNDGWYLRQDIIWAKGNPMPESVKDRCTKSHEYLFLLTKSPKYYFDNDAIKERAKYAGDNRGARKDSRRGTRMNSMSGKTGLYKNKRDVWLVNTQPNKEAHFATFPEALILPCVLAGCPEGGIILDPFIGSGTTALVALKNNRNYIGIELNPDYTAIAENRINRYAKA